MWMCQSVNVFQATRTHSFMLCCSHGTIQAICFSPERVFCSLLLCSQQTKTPNAQPHTHTVLPYYTPAADQLLPHTVHPHTATGGEAADFIIPNTLQHHSACFPRNPCQYTIPNQRNESKWIWAEIHAFISSDFPFVDSLKWLYWNATKITIVCYITAL